MVTEQDDVLSKSGECALVREDREVGVVGGDGGWRELASSSEGNKEIEN